MENLPENELVEDYVNNLCQLLFIIPAKDLKELRQEVREHLLLMVDMYEAEGLSSPEAAETALERFGEPRQIGQEMVKTWLKKHDVSSENTQSKSANIRQRVFRGLQLASAAGFGWSIASHIDGNSVVSASSLLLIAAWGAIFGLLALPAQGNLLRHADDYRNVAARAQGKEFPTRLSDAHISHRVSRWVMKKIMISLGRSLEERYALLSRQKPCPFKFGKLVIRLMILTVLLVLPIKNWWIVQEFAMLFVFANSAWLGEEVAYRTTRLR